MDRRAKSDLRLREFVVGSRQKNQAKTFSVQLRGFFINYLNSTSPGFFCPGLLLGDWNVT